MVIVIHVVVVMVVVSGEILIVRYVALMVDGEWRGSIPWRR
jgi:hypothetical protein